mmetsp:Transcript_1388/g.4251  ORF Transcript_1388/g.4251 Transcript_1388/m.4251 type:complete len:87 (+) Transcript_1388:495-755(+)
MHELNARMLEIQSSTLSPLRVGDDYNAMIKKMLTFDKCGINIARSDATLQDSSVVQPYPSSQEIYEENPEALADLDVNPAASSAHA